MDKEKLNVLYENITKELIRHGLEECRFSIGEEREQSVCMLLNDNYVDWEVFGFERAQRHNQHSFNNIQDAAKFFAYNVCLHKDDEAEVINTITRTYNQTMALFEKIKLEKKLESIKEDVRNQISLYGHYVIFKKYDNFIKNILIKKLDSEKDNLCYEFVELDALYEEQIDKYKDYLGNISKKLRKNRYNQEAMILLISLMLIIYESYKETKIKYINIKRNLFKGKKVDIYSIDKQDNVSNFLQLKLTSK
jgi:hypothetical protein